MADSVEFLQEYRDKMDFPMEMLNTALVSMGFDVNGHPDSEVVEIATRKLRTLHKLVLAGGMNPKMLEAIMAE